MLDSLERIRRQGIQSPPVPQTATAEAPPTDFFATVISPCVSAQVDIKKIPLDKIDPWCDENGRGQPFHLYSEEKLQELAENIRQNGLITPVRLRISPFDATRYQTLAGHNRIQAARLAGMERIDALVENVDDATARLILVDSNLYQREKILPSEKAFAYKLRMEAIKHQGKRTDLTSSQVETRLRTDELIAQTSGESRAQIQRYISLTRLISPLLDMVDNEAIPFTAGISIAALPDAAQERLWRIMTQHQITTISRMQAEALREAGEDLPESRLLQILGAQQDAGSSKPQHIRLALEVAPELAKKYRRDAELQTLIAATVRRYIEEKEAEKRELPQSALNGI